MSQIIAMAKRLQEYEQIIEDLKKNTSSTEVSEASQTVQNEAETQVHTPQTSPDQSSDAQQSLTNVIYTPPYSESQSITEVHESEGLLSDLSLDENGKVCIHLHQMNC
jgi:hypothetical protein